MAVLPQIGSIPHKLPVWKKQYDFARQGKEVHWDPNHDSPRTKPLLLASVAEDAAHFTLMCQDPALSPHKAVYGAIYWALGAQYTVKLSDVPTSPVDLQPVAQEVVRTWFNHAVDGLGAGVNGF